MPQNKGIIVMDPKEAFLMGKQDDGASGGTVRCSASSKLVSSSTVDYHHP